MLLAVVAAAAARSLPSGITFGKPVRLGPTDAMTDEFYAVGPLDKRVVFGIHPKMVASGRPGSPAKQVYPSTVATMSNTDGRSWEPIPQSCVGIDNGHKALCPLSRHV